MEQDWTKEAAIAAAKTKCDQACLLLEAARSIFHETGQDVRSANCSDAILYAREASE